MVQHGPYGPLGPKPQTMTNKEVVQQVIEAFNTADMEKMEALLTEDILFNWPGSFKIGPGKEAVREFFAVCPEILEFSMGHLIEEGHTVVATGAVTTKHEDGSIRKSHFCDWYTLQSGKVNRIESYVVFEPQNTNG